MHGKSNASIQRGSLSSISQFLVNVGLPKFELNKGGPGFNLPTIKYIVKPEVKAIYLV